MLLFNTIVLTRRQELRNRVKDHLIWERCSDEPLSGKEIDRITDKLIAVSR